MTRIADEEQQRDEPRAFKHRWLSEVMKSEALDLDTKGLLACIVEIVMAPDGMNVWMSQAGIGRRVGRSRSSVIRMIGEARKAGFVEYQRRPDSRGRVRDHLTPLLPSAVAKPLQATVAKPLQTPVAKPLQTPVAKPRHKPRRMNPREENPLAPVGDLAQERADTTTISKPMMDRRTRQRRRARAPIEVEDVLVYADPSEVAAVEQRARGIQLIGLLRSEAADSSRIAECASLVLGVPVDSEHAEVADLGPWGDLFFWVENESRACDVDLSDGEFAEVMHRVETAFGDDLADALVLTPQQSTWHPAKVSEPVAFFPGRFRDQAAQGRRAA